MSATAGIAMLAIRQAYDSGLIDKHQSKTLLGQLRTGDEDGALRGLKKLIRRTEKEADGDGR